MLVFKKDGVPLTRLSARGHLVEMAMVEEMAMACQQPVGMFQTTRAPTNLCSQTFLQQSK